MKKRPFSHRAKHAKSKHLTNKQRTQVTANQQGKIKALMASGAKKFQVISHMGYSIIVRNENNQLINCDWRKHLGNICAGDFVLVTQDNKESNNAIIEGVLERKNAITKQNLYRGEKVFAANLDQILITITHQPMFQPSLLDRYIVAARHIGLSTIVFFNKIDSLTNPKSKKEIIELQEIYQKIPEITWINGSATQQFGLTDLHQTLQNKSTVITGQSGVGKSSLINALIPDINVQTESISQVSGLGKHSTTNSTLYHLSDDTSFLIDTPGVRSFEVKGLNKQAILNGFVEILPYAGMCHFSDCSHTHEDNCAIKSALKNDAISQLRYDSFIQITQQAGD